MTLKQAMKRIEELERRVAQLEARQPSETHHHYHHHNQPPVYQPIAPMQPYPWRWPYEVTCGGSSGAVVGIGHNAN